MIFSPLVDLLIDSLKSLSDVVSPEVFTVVGAFVEEIIAPIPSPVVMTLAGSLGQSSGNGVWFLVWLAVLGAASKTFGAWIIYLVVDRMEDVFFTKFGRFFGVTHAEVEKIGKLLNHGWRDNILLAVSRMIPIMPTAPVSVVSGLIKIDMRTYISSTFIGLIVRNMFYLYFGYTSVGALESINEGFDSLEKYGYLALAIGMGILVLWFYKQRQAGAGLALLEKTEAATGGESTSASEPSDATASATTDSHLGHQAARRSRLARRPKL